MQYFMGSCFVLTKVCFISDEQRENVMKLIVAMKMENLIKSSTFMDVSTGIHFNFTVALMIIAKKF